MAFDPSLTLVRKLAIIPADLVPSDQEDFPVPVLLGAAVGTNSFNTTALLDELSVTAKSVVFDIADNQGDATYLGVRSIEFLAGGSVISLASTDFTTYCTSANHTGHDKDDAFDTSLSKTGAGAGTSWAVAATTNQRLTVVFDKPQVFTGIVVNNYHDSGTETDYGISSVKITASTDSITSTTYDAAIANSTELFDSTLTIHTGSDVADDEEVVNNLRKQSAELNGAQLNVEVNPSEWGVDEKDPYYPTAHSATYVKATSETTSQEAYQGTNPASSLTGAWTGISFLSGSSNITDQKVNIDCGSSFVATRIYIENSHNAGANTNTGIKNFILYGTNDADAFANTTYSNTDDLTALGTLQAAQHTASDVADPQYFDVSNSEAFRYYVLRIADGWGDTTNIGFRHIEIQGWDPHAVIYVKASDLSSTTDNEIFLTADSTQEDNSSYVGLTGESAAQQVWSGYFAVLHSSQDPSGGTGSILDSTSGGYDFTPAGTMLTADSIVSVLGRALDLDGVDDCLTSDASLASAFPYTLEALVTLKSAASMDILTVADKDVENMQSGISAEKLEKIYVVGTTTSQNSASITLPSGMEEGDLVMVISIAPFGGAISRASGYTELRTTAGVPNIASGYKIMGATPDTTATGLSVATQIGHTAIAYRGVDTTTPMDATRTTATGTNLLPNCPSITTVTDEAMVIAIGWLDDDYQTNTTAPAGYDLILNAPFSGASTIMVATKVLSSFGSDNPAAFGGSGNDYWHACTAALRPDSASSAGFLPKIWNQNSTLYSATGTTSLTVDEPAYLAGVFAGNTSKTLYLDGEEEQELTTSSVVPTGLDRIGVGKTVKATPGSTAEMEVDEIRLSSVERSPDWISITDKSLKDNLITWSQYPFTPEVDILVVAGGGGGGWGNVSGGGGAGGVVYRTDKIVTNKSYDIVVGGAGTGRTGYASGGDGGDSSGLGVPADGGGGGNGTGYTATIAAKAGRPGGCGGGGGGGNNGVDGAGGAASQGYAGGRGEGNASAGSRSGGGGGGMGEVGGDGGATWGGDGGDGISSDISGSSLWYGGGGGGSSVWTNGTGGLGGGTSGVNAGSAANGAANRGGGGGAADSTSTRSGDGGSGVVIIRFFKPAFTATGGTITYDGDYQIHTFTTSGTFEVSGAYIAPLVPPPPPLVYEKPENMFLGFPNPYRSNIAFPSLVKMNKPMLPKYTNFSGGGSF